MMKLFNHRIQTVWWGRYLGFEAGAMYRFWYVCLGGVEIRVYRRGR